MWLKWHKWTWAVGCVVEDVWPSVWVHLCFGCVCRVQICMKTLGKKKIGRRHGLTLLHFAPHPDGRTGGEMKGWCKGKEIRGFKPGVWSKPSSYNQWHSLCCARFAHLKSIKGFVLIIKKERLRNKFKPSYFFTSTHPPNWCVKYMCLSDRQFWKVELSVTML